MSAKLQVFSRDGKTYALTQAQADFRNKLATERGIEGYVLVKGANPIQAYVQQSENKKTHKELLAETRSAQAQAQTMYNRVANSAYTPKTTLEPVKNAPAVLLGGNDKVKRLTWFGHSGFSLARYMGKIGMTGGQAVAVFEALKIPMGKTAIIGGVYAGKNGQRGEPAQVTADQAKMIQEAWDKLPKKEEKVEPLTPKQEAKIQKEVEAIIRPAATGKGSKRKNHDAKLEAAVKARKVSRKK